MWYIIKGVYLRYFGITKLTKKHTKLDKPTLKKVKIVRCTDTINILEIIASIKVIIIYYWAFNLIIGKRSNEI